MEEAIIWEFKYILQIKREGNWLDWTSFYEDPDVKIKEYKDVHPDSEKRVILNPTLQRTRGL